MTKRKTILVCGASSALGQQVCKILWSNHDTVYTADISLINSIKFENYEYSYKHAFFLDLTQENSWLFLQNHAHIDDVYFLIKESDNSSVAKHLCIKFCERNKILNMVTLDNLHHYINLGPS